MLDVLQKKSTTTSTTANSSSSKTENKEGNTPSADNAMFAEKANGKGAKKKTEIKEEPASAKISTNHLHSEI